MKPTRFRATVAALVVTVAIVGGIALVTPVAAQQSSPVVEDSVELDGSTVTIAGGDVNAIGVQGIPDAYYPPTAINNGGSQQNGNNGIIWQTGGNVSFTLTPPDSAEAGDTVSFDVKVGTQDAQTVTLDIISSAAPPKVQQDTITDEGSTVSIVDTTGKAFGIENIPEGYYPPEDLKRGTLQQDSNGVIWQSGGNVSFTLTPPQSASPGDTVSFDIKRGSSAPRTVTLEVIDAPEEDTVDPDVYNAVKPKDDEVTAFTIVDAISEAQDTGTVDGVKVTAFDFVDLIAWNSNSEE